MSAHRPVNRTDRLGEIEQMLFHSSIGMSAVEIAKQCKVDRRTIYRDLSMLADSGVPIQQKDGRFYIDRDQYTATTRLTFDEAMALFLAARVASRYHDHYNPHLVGALEKVGQALPREIETHVQRVCEHDSETTLDLIYVSVLDLVTRAWSERRKINLYDDITREAKMLARDFAIYLIEPNADGNLCLIGFDSVTQQIRAINIKRIRRAKITNNTYKIPEQFDTRRYLQQGWNDSSEAASDVDVVLLFAPEAAPHLYENQWPSRHYRDRVERLPDDSLKVTLYVDDWQELLPWIRSWGAQVEVLGPPLLRQQCALEAAQMEARYRQLAHVR